MELATEKERIFLRLPATEDLARTSAPCVTFRHLVTDGSFLHRFRRLHPLPVLGYLNLAVQDIRDGRVLLFGKQNMMAEGPSISMFPELMVCDPLHRRYILLPPVPEDLVASVESQDDEFLGWSCEPSLIPLSDEEAALAEETSFRVIWSACFKTNMVVFVFSSSTGQWQAAAWTWSLCILSGAIWWVTASTGWNRKVLDPTKDRSSEVLFVKNPPITEFCKLDVKTMQVERMCAESRGFSESVDGAIVSQMNILILTTPGSCDFGSVDSAQM
ncbi:uncharacterized protein [Aegilops tauschii subsp. strangulata]|uniref:uncharacterized protein n=1 Tax=Aegilops tauschii subsp. strangulata TaxID=200361 RepID=UPI003CC8C65B